MKKAAAETEEAWIGAGEQVGTEIWRIEKFKVHRLSLSVQSFFHPKLVCPCLFLVSSCDVRFRERILTEPCSALTFYALEEDVTLLLVC